MIVIRWWYEVKGKQHQTEKKDIFWKIREENHLYKNKEESVFFNQEV